MSAGRLGRHGGCPVTRALGPTPASSCQWPHEYSGRSLGGMPSDACWLSFPGCLEWAESVILSSAFAKGASWDIRRWVNCAIPAHFADHFERFIKNIFIQKIGSKNDNSSKVILSLLSLCCSMFKKVISRLVDCSRRKSSGYWRRENDVIAATTWAKLTEASNTQQWRASGWSFSEDSRRGGVGGVVSIGNKGREVVISLLNLGSWDCSGQRWHPNTHHRQHFNVMSLTTFLWRSRGGEVRVGQGKQQDTEYPGTRSPFQNITVNIARTLEPSTICRLPLSVSGRAQLCS